jgi:beta-glucosidase
VSALLLLLSLLGGAVLGGAVLGLVARRLPRRLPHRRAEEGDGPFLFPAGFLWGAATADQQIEHQQPSDWTDFETRARALGLDATGPTGGPLPGHIRKIGEVAPEVLAKKADFDRLYADDLHRAVLMGHNAHRFSLSWARLFPHEDVDEPDAAAVDFYSRIFEEMKSAGLVPFVTLFHFASPAWLWHESGGRRGIERHDAVDHFEHFAQTAARLWGSHVRFWCTLNEPMVYVYQGYLEGTFPPNERRAGPREVVPVVRALLEMHVAAYQAIHEDAARREVTASVGIAQHVRAFMPWRNHHLLDRLTAAMIERSFITGFLDAMHTGVLRLPQAGGALEVPGLRGAADFIGVNHYGRAYVKTRLAEPGRFDLLFHDPMEPGEEWSDLGWASDEAALTRCLARFAERYQKPLYVLENGVADSSDDDVRRQRFVVRNAQAVWRAIQLHGADVRGYFHWSLIDNFEWAEGFDPRFGLYAVDYDDDFARRPRTSVETYRQIAAANAISADLWRRYRR